MSIDPRITTVVDRIADAWNYPMTPGMRLEYEEALNGLDVRALNKTVDEMRDVFDTRPSISKIKVVYDRYRPQTVKFAKQKPVSPIERAMEMARRHSNRIMACPAIDEIPTMAGKAMFRRHLSAVAFIECQGATGGMGAGIAYSAVDACGYGTWGDDSQSRRMVRDWFEAGRQRGEPDGSFSAAALAYCKTIPEYTNANKVREAMAHGKTGVKKLSEDAVA